VDVAAGSPEVSGFNNLPKFNIKHFDRLPLATFIWNYQGCRQHLVVNSLVGKKG